MTVMQRKYSAQVTFQCWKMYFLYAQVNGQKLYHRFHEKNFADKGDFKTRAWCIILYTLLTTVFSVQIIKQ